MNYIYCNTKSRINGQVYSMEKTARASIILTPISTQPEHEHTKVKIQMPLTAFIRAVGKGYYKPLNTVA